MSLMAKLFPPRFFCPKCRMWRRYTPPPVAHISWMVGQPFTELWCLRCHKKAKKHGKWGKRI